MTQQLVWTGRDRKFVETMIVEIGILLDVETSAVSVIRAPNSTQIYAIVDDTFELHLIVGPADVEVRRRVLGAHSEAAVDLKGLRARRLRLHCHALIERIQANPEPGKSCLMLTAEQELEP